MYGQVQERSKAHTRNTVRHSDDGRELFPGLLLSVIEGKLFRRMKGRVTRARSTSAIQKGELS